MKINNLTLDEILYYGGLGEITISSPEGWKLLEGLISDYVGTQAERLIDEDRQAYDEGYEDGKQEGFNDGEEVGYDKGWAECVKHYEIEE